MVATAGRRSWNPDCVLFVGSRSFGSAGRRSRAARHRAHHHRPLGDCREFLRFLAALPVELTGDVCPVRDDGGAFLSATGRGGDRVLYTLGPATSVSIWRRDLVTAAHATGADRMRRPDDAKTILLADDDDAITEALSHHAGTPGQDGRPLLGHRCGGDRADALSVTHVVTDVQFSGVFGFEGLHFLGRVRARAPQCRIVLMTGNASAALRGAAAGHGATRCWPSRSTTTELEGRSRRRASAGRRAVRGHPHPVDRRDPRGENLSNGLPADRVHGRTGWRAFAYEALTRVRGGWAARDRHAVRVRRAPRRARPS